MAINISDVSIRQTNRGYWAVFIKGEFYCSADSYSEAVEEVLKLCERRGTVV